MPRLLVTRPELQAAQWVQQLRTLGIDAAALPLLRIEARVPPLHEQQELQQALPGCALVMFVSPNAVAHFFAHVMAGSPWPSGVGAAATGPGTVQALRDAGVAVSCIAAPPPGSAQWDSQALWEVLRERAWAGKQVWIVRGEDGRDWLGDRLQAAGAALRFIAAYRRCPPVWDAPREQQLDAVLAQAEHHVWLFSSSQAVTQLADHLRISGRVVPWPHMAALATHPRIVAAAEAAGFARVVGTEPAVAAVAAAVHAMDPSPRQG